MKFSAPLTFVLTACSAFAAPVPIENWSFESPTLASGLRSDSFDFWITNGDQTDSNDYPGADSSFSEHIPGFAAEGNQHLGLAPSASVFLDLPIHYQPSTTYTLNLSVGNRPGHTVAGNRSFYAIQDTDNFYHTFSSLDAYSLPALTFAPTPPLQFTTPALGGPVGPVRVRLIALGSGRSHFDAISLDASPTSAPSLATLISDPGSFSLRSSESRELGSSTFLAPTNAWSVTYDPYFDKIYWSDIDAGAIYRCDRNGSNNEPVVSTPGALFRGLQVDSLNDTLYFIRKLSSNANIFSARLDGSGVAPIIPVASPPHFLRPNELALDLENDLLFVSDSGTDLVAKFDLSLASPSFKIIAGGTTGTTIDGPWGLAPDPETHTLYITAHDRGEVFSIRYDGSGISTIDTTNHILRGASLTPDATRLKVVDATSNSIRSYDLSGQVFPGQQLFDLNNPRDLVSFLSSDRDADFLDDAWENQHFGNIATASASTNGDGDQFDDLGEFAFGLDPHSPDSDISRETDFSSGAGFTTYSLSFPVRDGSDLHYHLNASPDLSLWVQLPTSIFTASDTASPTPGYSLRTISISLPPDLDRVFFSPSVSSR